jgi:hypothetical protein
MPQNPWGIDSAAALFRLIELIGLALWPALACLSLVSLIMRFRRSRGEQRQQLKWFTYAAFVAVGSWSFLTVTGLDQRLSSLLLLVFSVFGLWLIPAAIGIAILRYHLYAIDRLINRTLVFALLTALLGGVYAAVVLILGLLFGGLGDEPPTWAVAGATLAVAALFQPARRRIQEIVDRRFNRRRHDAAKTIEAFSARLRNHIDLDTLSAELLAVVNQSMEPSNASLWLRPDPDRAVESWHRPTSGPLRRGL